MRVSLRTPSYEDARHIVRNMRWEDVRELRDVSGVGPAQAVMEGLSMPGESRVGCIDDEPVALFGCAILSVLPARASPWFLATPRVAEARVPMLRDARRVVRGWRDIYGLLENVADGRNVTTLRWLRALGFRLGVPYNTPAGTPVVPFTME